MSAEGLGDVNLIGNAWLRDPAANPASNLAIGLGVKAPTGSNRVMDDFFTSTNTTRWPVDQSIQLGDGGVGIIVQAQGFSRLAGDFVGYLSGSYLVSPKTTTSVQFPRADGTGSGIFLSVPDVYSARIGRARAGLSVTMLRGTLSLSAPLRIWQDFRPDLTPGHPGGGDLADFLIFAGYTVRF